MDYRRLEDAVMRENVTANVLWEVLVEVAKLYCPAFEDALPACEKCIICLAQRYVKEHSE